MISRLLLILRRRWPILLVIPAVAALAGLALSPRGAAAGDPSFRATALVAVDQSLATETEVQQSMVQATEGAVSDEVASRLDDGTTPAEVRERVDATFEPDSFVVSLEASGPTREAAEALASTFGEVFVTLGNTGAVEDQGAQAAQAEADRDAARRARDEFQVINRVELASPAPSAAVVDRLAQLEADVAAAESTLAEAQVLPAPTGLYELISVAPAKPVATSRLSLLDGPATRALLGLVLGALAAVVVVVVTERSNPRIDDASQAEAIIGAPVLALVPVLGRRGRRALDRVDPASFRGPFAEAFRTLRSTIEFRAATEDGPGPRIMITSATPGEGKSTTTAYLALALAQARRPPLVIGGDLRRPTVHRMFGVSRTPGLTSRALAVAPPPLVDLVQTDPTTGVTIVPSGPGMEDVNSLVPDVVELCASARAAGRVSLLDTAPVRVANDAIDFLPAVDAVVLVVRIGRSTVRAVTQMMHTLRISDAQVAGVVVLGSADAADSSRYYYSYYSDGHRGGGRGGRAPAAPADAEVRVAAPTNEAVPV